MSYQSVDQLQKTLSESVFDYATDSKKAAGRALGTLVEILSFYALKSWGFEHNVAVERPLPEYANSDITHNVEFSLHPSETVHQLQFGAGDLPLTPAKIAKNAALAELQISRESLKGNALLGASLLLKNSCTVCEFEDTFINAYLDSFDRDGGSGAGLYTVARLSNQPFAMFECKRVGVEEGMRKGPQTIEKAKQGAYVARTVSSLQRIRMRGGRSEGVIEMPDGKLRHGEYYEMLNEIIASDDPDLLSRFILTVGVVSNHGNWFTSDNHNKELKVLAQSYDWLLFLTDAGLSQFIDELLYHPVPELAEAKRAFLASYTGERGVNQFTKSKINLAADAALQSYFASRRDAIRGWFNVIAPARRELDELHSELTTLAGKNWRRIHS